MATQAASGSYWRRGSRLSRRTSPTIRPSRRHCASAGSTVSSALAMRRPSVGGSRPGGQAARGPSAMSRWSNCSRAEERMQPAGLVAVEQAKADGSWGSAYSGQAAIEIPSDLAASLAAHPAAQETFDNLSRVNRYAVLYRIETAKRSGTRSHRIERLVEMLARRRDSPPSGARGETGAVALRSSPPCRGRPWDQKFSRGPGKGRDLRVLARTPPPAAERSTVVLARVEDGPESRDHRHNGPICAPYGKSRGSRDLGPTAVAELPSREQWQRRLSRQSG